MIQPDVAHSPDEEKPALFHVGCVGRITQLAESGDGRYILELTGIARFKVLEEMDVLTPIGNARWIISRISTISPRARARRRSTARHCWRC